MKKLLIVLVAFFGLAMPASAQSFGVKLIGVLPMLTCPRALTHDALSQTVAPLATVLGNSTSMVARVVNPSKWYKRGSAGAVSPTNE